MNQNRRGRPHGQQNFLEEGEIRAILAQPKRNTRRGLRDYSILLVLASTPIRLSELCQLQVGNMEGEGAALCYRVKKKRDPEARVRVPIPLEVVVNLKRYLAQEYGALDIPPDAPFFRTLGEQGGHAKHAITPRSVRSCIVRYLKAAGIDKPRISPHSFRASYLTLRADKNIPLHSLKELAGHSSLTTTACYLRANRERLQTAALAVNFA